MKKAILIIVITAFTLATFAQAKKDSLKQAVKSTTATAKKDTVIKPPAYKRDPKRLYKVELTYDVAAYILTTSKAGFMPYLETTSLQMNELKDVRKGFESIHANIEDQVNKQLAADREKFVADSLKAVKLKK